MILFPITNLIHKENSDQTKEKYFLKSIISFYLKEFLHIIDFLFILFLLFIFFSFFISKYNNKYLE